MTDAERELLLTLADLLLEETAGTYINRQRVQELAKKVREEEAWLSH